MDVLGYEGSAQLFVDGAIKAFQLPEHAIVNIPTFHSLLIFDLLFSNQDPHRDNIIFKKNGEEEEYLPFGIDHDKCMCYGDELKIQYLDIGEVFDLPLSSDLRDLVTHSKTQKYAEIMSDNGRPQSSIDWMRLVVNSLNIYFAIRGEKPSASELHHFLQQTFSQIEAGRLDYSQIDENYIRSKLLVQGEDFA